MNYNLKVLEKSDISSLTNLFNSLFLTKKKINFFLWQSYNYYLDDFIILGAFYKKNLIGSFGLQKKYDKKIKNAYMAHWPAVHTKYQSIGIFNRLVSHVLDIKEIDFIYNFFPIKTFDSIQKIMDLKSKIIDEFQIGIDFYDCYFSPINFKLSKNFNQIYTHNSIKKKNRSFYYNRAYRKWRYKEHPIYDYSIFRVSNNEFIIFKVFNDINTYIDIMEISVDLKKMKKNKNIIIAFLNFIKTKYNKSVINLWSIENIYFNEMLLSLGFKKINSKHVFGYRFFNDNKIKLEWIVQKNDSQKF